MTEQIPHWVAYEGNRYQLMTSLPQIEMILEELGVETDLFSTACRAGYVAEYEIEAGQFLLTKLKVAQLGEPQELIKETLPLLLDRFPPIEDVYPRGVYTGRAYSASTRDWKWKAISKYAIVYHLKYFCPVNGTITLVHGRYKMRRPHFQGSSHPQTLKVTLEHGYVKEINDITKEVAQIYKAIKVIDKEARKLPDKDAYKHRQQERRKLDKQYDELMGETI